MKKGHENYADYKMYMEMFEEASYSRKKNMLVEFMVRNGYDITDVCMNYNHIKMEKVRELFKENLIENLNQK